MTLKQIINQIEKKQSLLSIPLNPVINNLPLSIQREQDPLYYFVSNVVQATHQYVIAYEINPAYYTILGEKGWQTFAKIANLIKNSYPDIFLIADIKYGDIGNAAVSTAKTFFQTLPFDAVTINPYLGHDVITPYLSYSDKWIIILGLSANPSAWDIELIQEIDTRDYIFEKVFKYASWWADESKLMFIAEPTLPYKLIQIRHIVKTHFLLIPNIQSNVKQIEEICFNGLNSNYGLILSASQEILDIPETNDFPQIIASRAENYQKIIAQQLKAFKQHKRRKI